MNRDQQLFEISENYERRAILETLSQSNWSQTEAAKRLRIPPSILTRKIKRLRIDAKRPDGTDAGLAN